MSYREISTFVLTLTILSAPLFPTVSGDICKEESSFSKSTSFSCPRSFDDYDETYCCGSKLIKHCCDKDAYYEDSSFRNSFTLGPVIGGIIFFIVFVTIVACICCFCCRNCYLYKYRQRRGMVLMTAPTQQQGVMHQTHPANPYPAGPPVQTTYSAAPAAYPVAPQPAYPAAPPPQPSYPAAPPPQPSYPAAPPPQPSYPAAPPPQPAYPAAQPAYPSSQPAYPSEMSDPYPTATPYVAPSYPSQPSAPLGPLGNTPDPSYNPGYPPSNNQGAYPPPYSKS